MEETEQKPKRKISKTNPLVVKFSVPKEAVRKFDHPKDVFHVYAPLAEWPARQIPDEVNPRSHGDECLRSPVAKDISGTLIDRPEEFHIANRGITIIAQDFKYDSKSRTAEIIITDPENQGLADGATTDAVIAKVQKELGDDAAEHLKLGNVFLEINTAMSDRDRIVAMVGGRNTSRQVRGWSMSDFAGNFAWLQEIIEAPDSPFRDKIGWEENSGKDLTVLDLLSILTLFHPEFEEKNEMNRPKTPICAYSNKGKMDNRLKNPDLLPGYKRLSAIIPDILKLHDYIYIHFPNAYAEFNPKARFGRRMAVKALDQNTIALPLTGAESHYIIPNGLIFPTLAAFRALIKWPRRSDSVLDWRVDPFQFWNRHGAALVADLIEAVDAVGGNPNFAGKRPQVYISVYRQAQLLLSEELMAANAA